MEEKKISKKDTIKSVLAAIGGAGCWEVVHNIVTHTTPSGTGVLGRVLVIIGSTIITGMAGDAASDYVGKKFDHGVEVLAKLQESNENSEESDA